MPESIVDCFIAGELTRDYIVKSQNENRLDIPGGHALYAVCGMLLWQERPGLLSLVGEDYPQQWLSEFADQGIDLQGVHIIPETRDHRRFYGYLEENRLQVDSPISYFDRAKIPFPKALIGYQPQRKVLDGHALTAPGFCKIKDIPTAYMDCPSVHLCPMDYQSHQMLPDAMRQGHVTTISINASPSYMDPSFLDQIPYLVNYLAVFHISEENIRSLFRNRSKDLWEMAETIGRYGCELIVIHRNNNSYYLFNCANKEKWIVPLYPVDVINVIGVEDAFCGGFLAKFRKTFDPIESCLCASISASFTAQGFGPFHALDTYPGLPEARLNSLREMIRKI
ncbi:MAG: carbohydrate kinase family protein [Anaerolineaceae bacterium]|nr:carbohydrate kinase family protein [Anaerolineaceae bacterium]